ALRSSDRDNATSSGGIPDWPDHPATNIGTEQNPAKMAGLVSEPARPKNGLSWAVRRRLAAEAKTFGHVVERHAEWREAVDDPRLVVADAAVVFGPARDKALED